MRFFDCNLYFGLPAVPTLSPAGDVADVLAEMETCGVDQALVWHIAQQDASPLAGNPMLAQAIAPHPNLWGCWSILPNQAHEFPPFDQFLVQMKAARVVALRAFPVTHHFLLNEVSMGSWFEPMVAHRIPFFLSVWRGADWGIAYSLLAEFPNLVCVICDHGCWGEDRRFRPLLERYPHVYVDTAQYLLDGGIESLVADYGPSRLLFGSGFPEAYLGAMMLAIKHARIPEEARQAIASGNLEQILAEVIS